MFVGWKESWTQEDVRATGISATYLNSARHPVKNQRPPTWRSWRNTVRSSLRTASLISADKWGRLHGEPSVPATGARWRTWPAPGTRLCAWDKADVFTIRRVKQTENYKVHKGIFHIAEPCTVFTLEFPVWNSLSQGGTWLRQPRRLSWKCAVAGGNLPRPRRPEQTALFARSSSTTSASSFRPLANGELLYRILIWGPLPAICFVTCVLGKLPLSEGTLLALFLTCITCIYAVFNLKGFNPAWMSGSRPQKKSIHDHCSGKSFPHSPADVWFLLSPEPLLTCFYFLHPSPACHLASEFLLFL